MKTTLFRLFAWMLSLCAIPMMAQTRYHVNINNGDDTNDGLKWSTAFENLQTAIDSAKAGDEIWIAAGTYYPTQKIADIYGNGNQEATNDRHRSFLITKNIRIYGGFPANPTDATSIGSRNWTEYQTILSGDFEGNDGDNFENTEENAYHVIVLFDATPATILDGLYIMGGYANGTSTTYLYGGRTYYVTGIDGGGIYAYSPMNVSSPTLIDVSFYGNYAQTSGGAMYNYSFEDNASPSMTNVSFVHNKANARFGGALFNDGRRVNAELTNMNIVGNESGRSGGGLYFIATETCSPVITNAVINGNYANNGNGGGIYLTTYDGDAEPSIINSTICGNKIAMSGIDGEKDGGGLVIHSMGIAKVNILNTVIWGNKGYDYDNLLIKAEWGNSTTIDGSLIEGYDDLGATNLAGDTDPLFLDAVNADFAPTLEGDYQLTLGSPLINKGLNTHITASKDLLGNTRIFDNTVDIGAYESQGKAPVNNETMFSEKTIWSYNGNLYVSIDQTATLHVYSIDGTLVKHVKNLGVGAYEYTLPQGVYIVTLSDGTTEKVMIR